jgi:hypothetical protein
MDSDFDSCGSNPCYLDPTPSSISSFVLSTPLESHRSLPHGKTHNLLPCDKIHQSPSRHRAHLISVEVLSEIFLYTAQASRRSRTTLMLVCRHFRDIMLSTPGIRSKLRIGRDTEKSHVEKFGRRWLLDVIIDTGNWARKNPYISSCALCMHTMCQLH